MNKMMSCACADAWRDHAHAILRVVTGLAFFYHGYQKVMVMGIENVVTFFDKVGIPFAGLLAYLVAYGELLGGIALMVGFLTHWVSKANIIIMLGAIGFVHWGKEGGWLNGYGAEGGYEYPLLLLAVSFYFMAAGSGKFSVDEKVKQSN